MIIEGLSLIPTSAVKHVSRKKSFVFFSFFLFYNSILLFYIFVYFFVSHFEKRQSGRCRARHLNRTELMGPQIVNE